MNVTEPSLSTHARKRILYVITKANWGGAQLNVFDLATEALQKGYDVTVACGSSGELTARLEHAHIPVVFVEGLKRDVSLTGDPKALIHLRHTVEILRPDVVHVHSSKAGLLTVLAARIARVAHRPRIIFTAHGWAFNESRPLWQRAIFAFFHVVTVLLADNVICVSEAVKKQAAWMSGALKKCVVIHNGITPAVLKEKHAARAALAPHASNTFYSSFWIGTLAELHPTKGLDIAIRAFAAIAAQFPHAVLVLIGEGQDRNRLVALVQQYRLSDRVLFAGHVENAAQYLLAFDIFLFPSRSEALGYAALEAGNARLPVIASNVGGIPEIIQDGVTGILVPVGDSASVSIALTKLIEDRYLQIRLGNALHDVLPQFSQEKMAEQTFALY